MNVVLSQPGHPVMKAGRPRQIHLAIRGRPWLGPDHWVVRASSRSRCLHNSSMLGLGTSVGRLNPWVAWALASALGAAAAAPASAPAGKPCVMALRWSDDPPYFMRGADGQVQGLYADLLTEALHRLGCGVRLVELPFGRALVELSAGRVDVVAGVLRRPEREAYAHFAAPTLRSPNVLFAHVDAAPDPAARRLFEVAMPPFRLGAQIGVVYGPDFVALAAQPDFSARLVLSGARVNLWHMIELRRLDGIVADQATGRYELRQLGLADRIRQTAVQVSDEAASVVFSKQTVSADFVRRFEAVSAELVKDGTQAALLARYLGPDASLLLPRPASGPRRSGQR